MTSPQFDLLVRANRVFCAETGLDGPGTVAIRGDRIVAAAPEAQGEAREVIDCPDGLVLPGLVDLHAHPAPSDWKVGIDPDVHMLPRGTTTVLSQGDAGAAVWAEYKKTIVDGSRTRVRMAMSVALYGESRPGFSFGNLDEVDVDTCASTIEGADDSIWGISVNLGARSCGDTDPRELMRRALAIAERTGLPILFGTRREPGDWPLAEQLPLLRSGDVVTYCFQAIDEGIVRDGHVVDAAWDARERGILFDIGHGRASLDFGVAEAAIAEGFLPDTISTDLHKGHLGMIPRHDLPRTMSKLLAAGMSESDVLARVTAKPAKVLGLSGEIGTLAAGACADVTVLRWNAEADPLVDASGAARSGGCWEPVCVVRAGQVVRHPG